MDESLRQKMCDAAVALVKHVGYVNAGTVEFLLDEDESFYFMEMNTRIQVEHPVTEMVTGTDLVKEQIAIAAGEPISFSQKEVRFNGASIECRINAEDPDTFIPSPGTIHAFHMPGGPGVRIDTAAHAECRVLPHYDSLIAKLVVHGRDRNEAIRRMKRALLDSQRLRLAMSNQARKKPFLRPGIFQTDWPSSKKSRQLLITSSSSSAAMPRLKSRSIDSYRGCCAGRFAPR